MADVQQAKETVNEAVDSTETVEVWKQRSRDWEAKSKANFEALRKAETEHKALTEQNEKLSASLSKLEKENGELVSARDEALYKCERFSVALDHKVPADLLTGSTLEELEASAKRLQEFKSANEQSTRQAGVYVPKAGYQPKQPKTDSYGVGGRVLIFCVPYLFSFSCEGFSRVPVGLRSMRLLFQHSTHK